MESKNTKKPNILFLFADDQRFDTIHALGNKGIKTPNLDKLVKEGTTFTHAHIPGGTCGAVCMPSRAMLHTGRSLFKLDKQGQEIPEEHTLMGEVLRNEGYTSFGTGKWHNGIRAYARSFNDGDNIFFGGMHDHWCVPVHSYDPTKQYAKRIRRVENYSYNNKPHSHIADGMHPGEHSTDFIAQSVIDFLDKKHEQPFFAYVSFLAPHDPRTMPEEFRNLYRAEDIELPPNFMNYHPIEYNNTQCRDEVLAPYPRTIEDTKNQIAEYYGMISHLDYQIGRILDKLEAVGEKENTLIIYTADNGLALGQHGLFGKQNLYEHSVRVPLIFSGQTIPKNEQRNQLVYLYDIFPTLCDFLKLEQPESILGKSFLSAFENKEVVIRDGLYLAYTDKIRGLRKEGYKYIQHRYQGLETASLYNLEQDPYECSNLAQDPKQKDRLISFKEALKAYAETSGELSQELGQNYWGK